MKQQLLLEGNAVEAAVNHHAVLGLQVELHLTLSGLEAYYEELGIALDGGLCCLRLRRWG